MSKFLFNGHKLLWHMERVYDYFKYGKRIYPLHIDIGITKFCNAACKYCFGIYQNMTGEMIPKEALFDLFSTAPLLGIKSLAITGDGEPTVHPDIYDALWKGKHNGLDIGFATNGIKLDEEEIKILLNTCVWIRFNLSAVTPESYEFVHGVDKWDEVKKNILMAVKFKKETSSNCTLGLQMVLIPQVINEIIFEADFAVRNGLDYFVIKQFSDPGDERMSRFSLDWYDNPELIKTLKEAERLSTDKTKIVIKWKTMSLKGRKPYDHCWDAPLLFQISGSGKCYPCGILFGKDEYCYGDLKKNTLKEILDSEHYWELIKYLREDFDLHKICDGCCCRHDAMNIFMQEFLNPPEHLNFP